MPTLVTSNIVIDMPTLCLATVFVTGIGGLLLLFSWVHNRKTPALALWGLGYLCGPVAVALLASHPSAPDAWSVCAGNALVCGAYGMMWAGARSFEGRRNRVSWIAAGAVITIAACQFDLFNTSLQARVTLVSLITATYALLSAWELCHPRDKGLISRWPTFGLAVGHAGFLLGRIPLASSLTFPLVMVGWQGTIISVFAFEALFVTFCLAFLRVNMSKERAELEQRRAALTDSLTGIANRRAFFDVGEPLLDQTSADRRSAGLLLFDLDRFKEVNDTAGHQTGDRVLKAFSDLVTKTMRPGDLFGRIGGEEFACLLVNVSMAEALQTAERLRREFEAMRFAGLTAKTTVSVGVAMTTEAGRGLPALLAAADRALYRAKAEGRNRVAPRALVLIETPGAAGRRTLDMGREAAMATPLAG